MKKDALSQACSGEEDYTISTATVLGGEPVECAKGCISCVTADDCNQCVPTSYFNSGLSRCVCKFDYKVTIDDARQTDNEHNSNITIDIRNFDYVGDYANAESGRVDCRDVFTVKSNDHNSYQAAFLEHVRCFVSEDEETGEDDNGNDFTEKQVQIRVLNISSTLLGQYISKKFSFHIKIDNFKQNCTPSASASYVIKQGVN